MNDDDAPRNTKSWARLLRTNWSKRANSECRDFYVASHAGWRNPDTWRAQAKQDTELLLHELPADWLNRADVIEIGCGVGRLVPHLLERIDSYTGFDVAPEMISEARRRLAGFPKVRLFESDGLGIPPAAKDRHYDLAIAMAVFIHCPKEIVELLVGDTVSELKAGGRLRFQLLADPSDPTGVARPNKTTAEIHEQMRVMEDNACPEILELINDQYYMGHAFGFGEAEDLFEGRGGRLQLSRTDLFHIYGDLLIE